jgi:toxin ParE1/3/4
MKVTLHPAAEQDLSEAATFYEREGSPALAGRFIAEFKRLAQILTEHPEIGSPRLGGRRGFSMSIFPYTLIYRAAGNEIRILVVKHDSKRPGFGERRL